jgi:glyoxylase-like metal-dependent hydrolase (beta-lactamase superfamily II)
VLTLSLSSGAAMEIFRHIHQISSLVADRHLHQYLFVGDNTVLLDTGASCTPDEVILPYLQKIGTGPSRLKMAINTHADADHHGGNDSLKQAAGEMLLACGDPDRVMIEDPDYLFANRYNQWIADHGIGLANYPEGSAWVRKMVGNARRIDLTFCGGEYVAIDDKRGLRVLHVPGHSDGHLAVYDAANKAVFVGDALHGTNCPNVDGGPSLPPAYYSVLAYLGTLQFLESFEIEWIYSAHWPVCHGSQVAEFLRECRRFVDDASAIVWETLEKHSEGVTLQRLIKECGPVLGKWPPNNEWLLMYPMYGHLTYLEQQGSVKKVKEHGHTSWSLAASAKQGGKLAADRH